MSGSEALPPVLPVRAEDGGDGVLIDERLAGEDLPVSGPIFISQGNGGLDREGDLGIRDDLGKEDGMGMAAGVTKDPGDPEQGRGQTLVGEIPAFRFPVTVIYDNTKSLRIKQSDGAYVRHFYAGTLFILLKLV